jgi:hypothetical protein
MVDPRIISKITLPDLSRAIPRPRLIQRAIDAGAARMILITGQAAQGKSTLAAEIARQPGPACAWMHLDPPDSDPMNFFPFACSFPQGVSARPGSLHLFEKSRHCPGNQSRFQSYC